MSLLNTYYLTNSQYAYNNIKIVFPHLGTFLLALKVCIFTSLTELHGAVPTLLWSETSEASAQLSITVHTINTKSSSKLQSYKRESLIIFKYSNQAIKLYMRNLLLTLI